MYFVVLLRSLLTKQTWKRVIPRKKAGGVGSRTLKGKNNTSSPRQATVIIPSTHALPIAVPPTLSVTQLQCKLRDDANIKEQLRKQIKDESITKEQLREKN